MFQRTPRGRVLVEVREAAAEQALVEQALVAVQAALGTATTVLEETIAGQGDMKASEKAPFRSISASSLASRTCARR